MTTSLYTQMLMVYGFSVYNKRETFLQMTYKTWGCSPNYEELSDALKKRVDQNLRVPMVSSLIADIKKRPGVWLFVTVSDFDESWQETIKQQEWEKRVMFRSVPTRNYNYNQPDRLLTLYIMDFRDYA